MPTVPDIHRRGTRAAQGSLPPPLTVGTLYYVTDETKTERWNGSAWETYGGPAAGAGAPPTPHATTHEAGGTDAIPLDTLAAPSDITTLNASASAHGLLPKLSGSATDVLKGDGTWGAGGSSTPAASSYTTAFAGVENPLSESGHWAAVGAWHPCAKNNGVTPATDHDGSRLTDVFGADQFAEITYASTPGSANWVGVMTRIGSTTNGTCYVAIAFNTSEVRLYKAVDTGTIAYTLLTSATGIAIGTAPRRLRLSSVGTQHTAYFNGVQVLTFTDASYPTGSVGIAGVAPPGVLITGFTGGTLTTGLPGPHHTTHETGGSDAITTLDASVITTGTIASAQLPPRLGAVGLILDGGGSAITTGVKGFVTVPFACTITGWTLLSTDAAATAGSIVIDVWKAPYASYPPTVANTITASALPTLSSANKNTSTTLTGWTTAIAAGDVLGFNVNSVTTVTRVVISLMVQA